MSYIKTFENHGSHYDVLDTKDMETVKLLQSVKWEPDEFEKILEKIDVEKSRMEEISSENKVYKLSYRYLESGYSFTFELKLQIGDKYGYIFPNKTIMVYKKDDGDGLVNYYLEIYDTSFNQYKILECDKMRYLIDTIGMSLNKNIDEL